MRIAFDLDGVLADLHAAFTREVLSLYPELDRAAIAAPDVGASPPLDDGDGDSEVPEAAGSAPLPLDRRQLDAVWKKLRATPNFWEGLAEIETGAIRRLAALAEQRRWDVLFITSRPSSSGSTVQRQSQRWLQSKGFVLPSVCVVHGSRGAVAQALDLDVVVDDRPDNCLDVVLGSKAGAVLIWRGPQAKVPASAKRLGIAVSPTVEECLSVLTEAETSAGEGSLLDQLRRLFGLKTRAASTLLRKQ
ncbi:MAG TPA: hypothetical protein VN700_08530 [Vicinamibacterales bacterium]|nr:hypothetical protein [Vicinamibacterales bacterium]